MSQIVMADMDEIVFEPRNKAYGAYVLRKEYKRNTLRAFIIGTIVLLLSIFIPFVWSKFDFSTGTEEMEIAPTEAVLKEPPPINEKEQPEEVKVEPPPPPQRAQVRFVPPEVVEHEEAKQEVTIQSVDSIKADVGTQDVEGDLNAPPDIGIVEEGGTGTKPVEVAVEKEPDPDEFVMVEKNPEPVNLGDIKKSIEYPPICKEAGIQGKVFIKMLVNKEGKPIKHKVMRSPHELLTKACEKEIYKLSFTPGIQAGKPIMVWVTIPFDFKLR